MAILKTGRYLGKHKNVDGEYFTFVPDTVFYAGEVKYFRIGDYNEEFPTDRSYMLLEPNEEELELIQKANEIIK